MFVQPNKRLGISAYATPRLWSRGVFLSVVVILCVCSALCGASTVDSQGSIPDCHLKHWATDRAKTAELVEIEKVIDGDTLRLRDGRKVRLIGVNTPEFHPGAVADTFAGPAKSRLERLLVSGKAIISPGEEAQDKHGRTLAHVFGVDGSSVEANLIKAGLAWHIAIPPNVAFADCLAPLELDARISRQGVWGLRPVPVKAVKQGGFQRIQGRVDKISFGRNWWISMEGHLALKIVPEEQHYFDREEVSALTGKSIEIKGWVYPSHSRKYEPWRINLQTPHAIYLPR